MTNEPKLTDEQRKRIIEICDQYGFDVEINAPFGPPWFRNWQLLFTYRANGLRGEQSITPDALKRIVDDPYEIRTLVISALDTVIASLESMTCARCENFNCETFKCKVGAEVNGFLVCTKFQRPVHYTSIGDDHDNND